MLYAPTTKPRTAKPLAERRTDMDAEVIKALGQYVIGPIAMVVIFWIYVRGIGR